jgi:hypothetical protein
MNVPVLREFHGWSGTWSIAAWAIGWVSLRSRKHPSHQKRGTGAISDSATTEDQMIQQQHDHRAYNRYEHAVEVEARDAVRAKEVREDEASHERADDAQQNVDYESLTGLVDELAGNEPGN